MFSQSVRPNYGPLKPSLTSDQNFWTNSFEWNNFEAIYQKFSLSELNVIFKYNLNIFMAQKTHEFYTKEYSVWMIMKYNTEYEFKDNSHPKQRDIRRHRQTLTDIGVKYPTIIFRSQSYKYLITLDLLIRFWNLRPQLASHQVLSPMQSITTICTNLVMKRSVPWMHDCSSSW